MSNPRCWLQLPGWKNLESDAFERFADSGFDELEAACLDRTRTANVPACGQCAVPNLLGVQSAAARQPGEPADSDYALHVPSNRGGGLHLSSGSQHLRP